MCAHFSVSVFYVFFFVVNLHLYKTPKKITMYNVETAFRRHKFPMSFWVGGSTCPAAVLPTQGGCIPSRTIKIKRLIFISTSITAANAANLIPTFLTPYNYIGAGVTNAPTSSPSPIFSLYSICFAPLISPIFTNLSISAI